ncbi:MAG: DNA-processing protein DprA [Cellvibrionaceae bacterium]|nr:DNA-processing protein DprA [Cellvibrionaceae bacterium]
MKAPVFHTLLLSLLPGVGPRCYWSWMKVYPSPAAILDAPVDKLPRLNERAQSLLLDYQRRGEHSELAQQAQRIAADLYQQRAKLIAHHCEQYPALLKQIYAPPPLLYVRGKVDLLSMPQIAIVGTRHPTHGGRDNARIFAHHLAASGFTITSGLALGVDGVAHRGALDAGQQTIAVMGTGIDLVYPRRHRQLADDILQQQGVLVTEFAPTTGPNAANFPRRNRIISGLSLGVLVIEAALKSGSLITARCALEQNREVFSLPGSIHNTQSKGCHALIKQGAHLVETGQDIVDHLGAMLAGLASENTRTAPEATCAHNTLARDEQALLACLDYEPVSIEQLMARSGLSSHQVSAGLLILETKGWVRQSSWGYERVYGTNS